MMGPEMGTPAGLGRWLSELASMPDFLERAVRELGADRASAPGRVVWGR